MPFLETSAKETHNVDMAFETMTKEIKEKQINLPRAPGAKNTPGGHQFGQGRALP